MGNFVWINQLHEPMGVICHYYHIVICTKNRQMTINDEHKQDLYRYLNGVIKKNYGQVKIINGMPDHIHILVKFDRVVNLSDVVHNVKLGGNYYMRKLKPEWFPLFQRWATEFASFSCSAHDQEKIMKYIARQESHHQQHSLTDELKSFYQSASIENPHEIM